MFLCSPTFIFGFMPIAVILYWILPLKYKIRKVFLILSGILFYSFGDEKYVLLFLTMAIFTYLAGIGLDRIKIARKKKFFSGFLLILLVTVLAYFKYWNYLAKNVFEVSGFADVAMPMGISFFVFKEISYTVDVYRGKIKAQYNPINVLSYVCFFPQIISGPISRYEEIEEGLASGRFSIENIGKGFKRFGFGFFQKMVIAGAIGKFVDEVYALDSSEYSFVICILAAICYSLQLFMDFAGYSAMSIGISEMLGIKIKENFDYPFISKSISEFWRRWHVSLSSWFKEYVYIPLGGNRCSKIRTCFNKMFVFILTGIWHGSSITFLLWGFLHGVATTTEVFVKKRLPNILSRIVTLLFIAVTFSIFRAESIEQAGCILKGMITFKGLSATALSVIAEYMTSYSVVIFVIAILFCIPLQKLVYNKVPQKYNLIIKAVPYLTSILLFLICLMKVAVADYSPFIYFNF